MVRLSPPERIGEFFGIYGLVGKGSQVVGQILYGAIIFLLLDTLGNGAYQVAVLSLLVTMLIGLWLVWPVSDRWAGSGELARVGPAPDIAAPPPRLAPDRRRWTTATDGRRRPSRTTNDGCRGPGSRSKVDLDLAEARRQLYLNLSLPVINDVPPGVETWTSTVEPTCRAGRRR